MFIHLDDAAGKDFISHIEEHALSLVIEL